MTDTLPDRRPARLAAGFAVLFVLYQSAEGIGDRVLHAPAVQAGLMVAALLAAWPIGRWLGYRGYEAYGLERSRRVVWLVLGGLVLAAACRFAALAWGLRAGWYVAAPAPALPGFAQLAAAVAGAALSTFVPSLAEDILTRGFWLRAAQIAWRGTSFVLATSAIYLLNHIYRLEAGPLEWLRLFAFGIAYAGAAWKWRSLWAALGLHWGWNLANTLLGLFAPFAIADATAAAILSAGAHLAMAAAVLLLPGPRPHRKAAQPS